jgi:glutamine---fructose-6-phosphate transaminase (isomerizing)
MAQGHTLREIEQIPSVLEDSAGRQRAASLEVRKRFGTRMPRLVATIGRGSSDHVATFLRYAFEIQLGVPGASIAPSIASVYGRQLMLEDALCLVISQSGRSPDIRQAAAMARRGGATVVAIVNDESSPLAEDVDVVIPICAGPELAVAATKSFVGAAAAGLRLLATLSDNDSLHAGLDGLPGRLGRVLQSPNIDLEPILWARTAFVVGRGPALGIAQEAALKLKEIVQFPAEAYSSAEVLHGPWQLAETDCALIAWSADRESLPGQRSVVEAFRALGRPSIELQDIQDMPTAPHHQLVGPLIPLPLFYRALVKAAQSRGLDPDRPRLLKKITETT